MSALQLQRMLGLGSYRSAWFMCHRLREALAPVKAGPIGGENKVVEADETFIGGKKKNRAFAKKEPKKQVVLSAVAQKGSQWLMISNCQESAAGMSRLTASAKAFNSASLYAGTRLQSMSQFAGGQILQRCIPLYPGKSKISVELNMCALN
jgi:hypothetical protein